MSLHNMDQRFRPNVDFRPWGPFIPPHYENEIITNGDFVVASVIWFLTLVNAVIAVWLAVGQTKQSHSPRRSVYIWMIWIELLANVSIGVESYLHLLKVIRPNFYLYFSILVWWCIEVQLLLQIIINRIRLIIHDPRRGFWIMVVTASMVGAINISIFFIWMPARLQIAEKYIRINTVYDPIEKVIYLLMDASLNFYFIKVVKYNLVNNGLQKYNALLKFNQRIIVLSLLMDVMIIAAMSIPNSFIYVQFHPLAYLVKLNIEMTMANLIKRVAFSTCRRTSTGQEFATEAFECQQSFSDRYQTLVEMQSVAQPPPAHLSPGGGGRPPMKKIDSFGVGSSSGEGSSLGSREVPAGGTQKEGLGVGGWRGSVV